MKRRVHPSAISLPLSFGTRDTHNPFSPAKETQHARQVSRPAESRRRRPLRQARRYPEEQVEGRLAPDGGIDEREAARGIRFDQAQGQARACRLAIFSWVVSSNDSEIASD